MTVDRVCVSEENLKQKEGGLGFYKGSKQVDSSIRLMEMKGGTESSLT